MNRFLGEAKVFDFCRPATFIQLTDLFRRLEERLFDPDLRFSLCQCLGTGAGTGILDDRFTMLCGGCFCILAGTLQVVSLSVELF